MDFLSKFFNYNKEGPGVTKNETETGLGKFFRILVSKFWKICTLNMLYVVCLIPIIAMCVGLYNITPLSEMTTTEKYLETVHVASEYKRMADKYIRVCGIDDATMVKINSKIGALIETVNSVNPEVITDGSISYEAKKYNAEINKKIYAQFTDILNTIENDRFTVEYDKETDAWSVIDKKHNDFIFTKISVADGKLSVTDGLPDSYTDYFYWVLVLLPFALIGPITAGAVKVSRDFVREEPVFLFSDFRDAVKKNFFPSLIISTVQYIAGAIIINAISLYYAYFDGHWIYMVGFAAALLMAFLFIAMHFYIMLMQVTLKLSLKKIYKNAFYFSIICLVRNIFLVIGLAALLFLLWLAFNFGMAFPLVMAFLVLIVLTFLIGFVFFVVMYAVYPPIKRVVIDPYYAEHKEETSEMLKKSSSNDKNAEDSSKDTSDNEISQESEYVYHNGRMVHRSTLESEMLFRD